MERERRVIKITCAASLVPPSPFSCSLHSDPHNSFIVTSITLTIHTIHLLNTGLTARYVQSSLQINDQDRRCHFVVIVTNKTPIDCLAPIGAQTVAQ